MNKPRRLSGIVKNVSDPIFGKKSMLYGELISNWSRIVGDDVASYALPVELKFRRGENKQNSSILKLAVTSARSQDVLMQKPLLIEKLNQFMGFRAIEDIRLIHRPHKDIQKQTSASPTPQKLSADVEKSLKAGLSAVENEELKNALEALGTAVYARQNPRNSLQNND